MQMFKNMITFWLDNPAFKYDNRTDPLMDYFRNEYKENARWAYEYYRSTGKMSYYV